MRRPLLDHFPRLGRDLPWVPLATLPTPVQALGGHGWIKRDDLSGDRYGGNKVRKLETLLGAWRAQGIRRLVTFGAIGTNAGLATALLCHDEGWGCDILAFDQPWTPTVAANLAAMRQLGARLIDCRSLAAAYATFRLHPARLRADTAFLFAGCSNPPATLAYVNAAFELAEQIAAGCMPEPAEIVVAVGSASTAAGLTLGCALAGLRSRVVGVRVAPARVLGLAACTPETIAAQIETAASRLGYRGRLPQPLLREEFYGAGYGLPTPAASAACTWFAEVAGLRLETTYTGKAVACWRERLAAREDPILYWHTYNSRPLAPLPQAANRYPLPARLHRLMETAVL